MEFPDEFGVALHDAADFSFGVPDEDELSITASVDGLMPSDSEDSPGLSNLGAVAHPEFDAELTAMLARAAASIELEWIPPPCSERSQLDDWYLGSLPGST